MEKNSVIIASLVSLCSFQVYADAPYLGKNIAKEHQICGKSIEIQIADIGQEVNGNSKILLGLTNKKTGKLDLFMSQSEIGPERNYGTYHLVTYDALSDTYITPPGKPISLLWGSAMLAVKGISYSLALGTHVYPCQSPAVWPDETANDLYGDHEDMTTDVVEPVAQ